MASLMQRFADARQKRLHERSVFGASCELARQSRQKDLQAQASATSKYLAHAEQSRLAWEQGRQVIAEIALESRQEEIQNRAEKMTGFLQDLTSIRTERAIEDSAERAQAVRTRTFKTRSHLKHIHKARIKSGRIELLQRQQLAQERSALMQMQLEDLTKIRHVSAAISTQQRVQEASVRAINVKSSLAQTEANRLAKAEIQSLQLASFSASLRSSVWSSDRAVAPTQANISVKAAIVDSAISNSSFENKKSLTEKVVIKVAEPAIEVKEPAKTSGKIEQFVVDYVAQLSTNSSLLEVVNDRDTVRDLLAQGANTLKVDPSDILNTLLQMAEGS